MKCAGEIMLPLETFPYIPYWFTLRQALAKLEDAVASGESAKNSPWIILVFNAQSEFLGIVQRQDILHGLRPDMHGKIRGIFSDYSTAPADPNLSRLSFSPEKAIQELKSQIERQIIEFMTPVKVTVDYHDPLLLAIYLMIDHGLTFVPVMKSDQIVGVVYIEDALNEAIAPVI
jgi:CBS-domain-containing membrane protein